MVYKSSLSPPSNSTSSSLTILTNTSPGFKLFLTSSPRLADCSWLRLSSINRYYYENNKLVVEFKNKDKIVLDTSYGIVDNQVLRATRLESVLNGRKLEKKVQKKA